MRRILERLAFASRPESEFRPAVVAAVDRLGRTGMTVSRKLGQHRWFILAVLFLGLNSYGIYALTRTQRSRREATATLIEPENGRVASGSKAIVKWHFSADMVEDDATGKWQDDGPVDFSPIVAGSFCWVRPNELAFRPDRGWPGCTEFAAEFPGQLHSPGSAPLAGQRIFRFRSDPLAVVRVSQTGFPHGGRVRLSIEFNDTVAPAQLQSRLAIRTPDGRSVPFRMNGHRNAKTIGITLRQVPSNNLVVSVGSGLQGLSGPLDLEADTTMALEISHELRVLHAEPELAAFGFGSVKATLNAPVDLSTAARFIKVQPYVKTSVESYYSYHHGNRCRILGEFRAGRRYAVTFCKGLRSAAGGILEQDITRTIAFRDAAPCVEFTAKGSYLSPRGSMRIPFRTINAGDCKATVRRVYSNNLVQLAARRAGRYDGYHGTPHQGISGVVGELEIPVAARRNEVVETQLDLGSLLKGKSGAFHVEVRGKKGARCSHYIVLSDTGLTVKRSEKDVLVWVNSLRTLAPVPDARVCIFSLENQLLMAGDTDAEGIARFDLALSKIEGDPFLVTIEKGEDVTFLRLDSSRVHLGGGIGSRPYLDGGYEAYLYTDRGIYRPGETAHLKAIVRGSGANCPDTFPVKLTVYRPDGKVDRSFDAILGDYGTAEFDVPWPDFVPTGKYRLEATVPGAKKALGKTTVSLEEFVPPQVRAKIVTEPERLTADRDFEFVVFSEHLFGRPAAGLAVSAGIEFMPHAFRPAQWPDYAFGDARRAFRTVRKPLGRKSLSVSGKAVFRAAASAQWRPPAAIKAMLAGTVNEMSGRSVTAYGSRVIDVYPFYIGIRRPSKAVRAGIPHAFEIAAVRPDGTVDKSVRRLSVAVEKITWVSVLKEQGGHYRYGSEQQVVPIENHEIELKEGRATTHFTPTRFGQYRLSIEDPVSGPSSSLDFYAGASGQGWASRSMEKPDLVELTLDKEQYLAGDEAALVIRSPFAGKALVTVESDRVLRHRVLDMTNNTAMIRLPVKHEYGPNVYCAVTIVRPALAEETWTPHRAAGRLPLLVDLPERRFGVAAKLPSRIRPGTRLEVPVSVTDNQGKGCKCEVLVAAVDEGICMLTAFPSPDPYAFFFAPRLPGVELHDLYAELMPEAAEAIPGTPSEPGGGGFAGLTKRLNPIKARRFRPVALWSATTLTDDNGRATVAFDVPEFTGQLRFMAVAVDKQRFGCSAQSVHVKRPLIVQSSLPRFLAPSDSFVMPVRILNETGKDGKARVEVLCKWPSPCEEEETVAEQSFPLPAGSTTNLSFRIDPGALPGRGACRLRVSLGSEVYEEETEIAVRPPAALAAFSGSGVVEPGKQADPNIPAGWLAGTEKTEIRLSALPAVKLGGSIDYLLRYPYGCIEQTTSKALPLLYLVDLVEQAAPGWLDRKSITDMVNAGIHRILSMQRGDGSFGYWPGCGTYRWGSVYATHFLAEAGTAGYDVPKARLQDALQYLEKLASGNTSRSANDEGRGLYDKSYACFVLALAGKPQHGNVARLLEQEASLDRGAQVNLAAALVAGGKRRDALQFLDNIGGVPVSLRPREIGGSLRSGVRNDAVLLSTLLDVDPRHKYVPLLAKRLESAQTRGRWHTTQDNAMALLALGKYCNTSLGDGIAAISGRVSWNRGTKSARFADKTAFHVELASRKDKGVSVSNEGSGTIYYYWRSEGVPADGYAREMDRGIAVRRALLDLDGNPADTHSLRQGDLFVVKTTIRCREDMDNVVIEDLLPAGLEIENAVLKTSQAVPWIRGKQNLPLLHRDIRDDRMIAFTGPFSGEKSCYHAVRAVTVGDFVLPAISASCMYDSDIQSIHGRGHVRVVNPE